MYAPVGPVQALLHTSSVVAAAAIAILREGFARMWHGRTSGVQATLYAAESTSSTGEHCHWHSRFHSHDMGYSLGKLHAQTADLS